MCEDQDIQCPDISPSTPAYDWECDPRKDVCAQGQYGEPIVTEYLEYTPPPPLEEKSRKQVVNATDGLSSDEKGLCSNRIQMWNKISIKNKECSLKTR